MDSQHDILAAKFTGIIIDAIDAALFWPEALNRHQLRHCLKKDWDYHVPGAEKIFNDLYKTQHDFIYGRYAELYLERWSIIDVKGKPQ